ncbi:CrcB family protein [Nocardioides sp. R-C-SC26]|uniref:fluoride efflux transporter FluC n=1 Tax=Nocardioides sp. R-C-SC26 TaxID=2870414 RepID=UPI001E4EBEFD|nr:CrcB family protein [Nocardioides sp. R-C-SC26]
MERRDAPTRPTAALSIAVAAGGAIGALARWGVDVAAGGGDALVWATVAINVGGSALLAALPALALVRRSAWWATALGPGVLGGFTTMSACAEQARALIAEDRLAVAGGYLGATVLGGALAVAIVHAMVRRRPTEPGGLREVRP